MGVDVEWKGEHVGREQIKGTEAIEVVWKKFGGSRGKER